MPKAWEGTLQLHRLSFHVSRWFRRYRVLLRRLGVGAGAVALLSVVLQLVYPAGRLLPLVSVEGLGLGGSTVAQAKEHLDSHYAKAKLVLKTQDDTFTKSFDEVGIDPESWNTARAAADYSVGERLLPFSSIFIVMRRDTPMKASFDDDRLNYFAAQVQKDGYKQAVNATISVKNGSVALVSAKKSREYPVETVATAIRSARFTNNTTVTVAAKMHDAQRTDNEVKGVLGEAQRAVNMPLILKLKDEEIKVSKSTVGDWLDFAEDPQSKQLQLTLKADVVKKYLDSIQGKVYKAPGTTKVQIIDGREVGRTVGAAGQGVDADKTIAALQDVLKKGKEATVTVPIVQLPPKIVYERQYSNTDAGLAAMLRELAASRGYGISVMELNGRSANANGDKKFVAASTYKLFVAYAVFKQIEAGQMSWGQSINGNTVEGCFEVMIVNSNNPCAKAFGDRIGWQNIENMMRGLGLANTELSPSLYTTANDLSLFLYKLQNGSLVSAADQARLLGLMKRQIYRQGIPQGTGLSVADKVGFIDSYIHDAGIVYGPRGPYVMVIMTSGSSWSGIADAARQINSFLNR
jgi:beta-lactamase class A